MEKPQSLNHTDSALPCFGQEDLAEKIVNQTLPGLSRDRLPHFGVVLRDPILVEACFCHDSSPSLARPTACANRSKRCHGRRPTLRTGNRM